MKWKDFFPHKELKGPPYFDGRVVCYPRAKMIRDYLAWRQVDCKCTDKESENFVDITPAIKAHQDQVNIHFVLQVTSTINTIHVFGCWLSQERHKRKHKNISRYGKPPINLFIFIKGSLSL